MAQPASDLGSKWVTVPKKFKGIKSTSHPTTLKYVTALEEEMLRRADPHNSNIDRETHYGPGGIESLNDSGLGDSAPGESEGTGYGGDPGGYSGYGGWGDYGADNTGAQVGLSGKGGWGSAIGGGPIGDPGDDPRASEGGGEVIRAAKKGGVVKGNGVKNGGANGGADTPAGPTEAELLADRIEDAMNAISSLFAGREGVYSRARDASYDLSKSGIMDSYGKAKRRLNFQMLRQGLDTGQPDIDLRADLSKVMNDSLAEAMRHADRIPLNMRTADATTRARANTAALSGRLTPGQARNMVGTLSAGVPQAWGGISDIGWNIPTGFAPSGYGGFTPDWRSRDTGAYFGSSS